MINSSMSTQLTINSTDQLEYETRIKPWCQREQKDDKGSFSLDFEITQETSLAFKATEFFKLDASANSSISASLVGTSGRRLKLKKPEKFLKEEVMTQVGVQEWIRTQASISHSAAHWNSFKAPKIWMVTGVQLITGGSVQVGSSTSTHGALGASADPGPAVGLPPGLLPIGGEVNHGHGSETNSGYSYTDERVWAAQFMEIKIEYGKGEDKGLQKDVNHPHALPATIATFNLEDIADLRARGTRGSQKQREDANGQMLAKTPILVGRVVVDDGESDSGSDGPDDMQIDDRPYVDASKDTDWDMYNECVKYLRDTQTAEIRGNSNSPELIQGR
jgi:hypothetical protein